MRTMLLTCLLLALVGCKEVVEPPPFYLTVTTDVELWDVAEANHQAEYWMCLVTVGAIATGTGMASWELVEVFHHRPSGQTWRPSSIEEWWGTGRDIRGGEEWWSSEYRRFSDTLPIHYDLHVAWVTSRGESHQRVFPITCDGGS